MSDVIGDGVGDDDLGLGGFGAFHLQGDVEQAVAGGDRHFVGVEGRRKGDIYIFIICTGGSKLARDDFFPVGRAFAAQHEAGFCSQVLVVDGYVSDVDAGGIAVDEACQLRKMLFSVAVAVRLEGA